MSLSYTSLVFVLTFPCVCCIEKNNFKESFCEFEIAKLLNYSISMGYWQYLQNFMLWQCRRKCYLYEFWNVYREEKPQFFEPERTVLWTVHYFADCRLFVVQFWMLFDAIVNDNWWFKKPWMNFQVNIYCIIVQLWFKGSAYFYDYFFYYSMNSWYLQYLLWFTFSNFTSMNNAQLCNWQWEIFTENVCN